MENNIETEKPLKKVIFTPKVNLVRFLVLILLSAFSYGLSMLGKIPGMQVRDFFPIEPSDTIVLFAYVLYGFWASLFVALMKTGLLMVTFLSSVTLPIPLEGIVHFMTSFFLAFASLIIDRSFRVFHRKWPLRLLAYFFITVFVSLSMVSFVYAFVIPIALNGYRWTTIYQVDISSMMKEHASFFPYPESYGLSIIRVYLPYCSVKILSECLIYEIFFHPLVSRVLKSGILENNYYMSRYDLELSKRYVDLKTEALKEAELKEARERKIEVLKKRNAREAEIKEARERRNDPLRKGNRKRPLEEKGGTQYDCRFDMTIDDYGSIHNVSIKTDSESPQIIIDYMRNSHPGSKFHISSYKEGNTLVRDASSDGLSEELFRSVNGYDREETKIIEVSLVIRNQKMKKTIS